MEAWSPRPCCSGLKGRGAHRDGREEGDDSSRAFQGDRIEFALLNKIDGCWLLLHSFLSWSWAPHPLSVKGPVASTLGFPATPELSQCRVKAAMLMSESSCVPSRPYLQEAEGSIWPLGQAWPAPVLWDSPHQQSIFKCTGQDIVCQRWGAVGARPVQT